MAVTTHSENLLAHIDGPKTLAGRTALSQACISLLGVIKVCASVSGDNVDLTVSLMGVEIGHAVINAKHPSVTIGGSAAGFTAEVKITLDIKKMTLEICGTLCAPIVGCKKGCTTIHI